MDEPDLNSELFKQKAELFKQNADALSEALGIEKPKRYMSLPDRLKKAKRKISVFANFLKFDSNPSLLQNNVKWFKAKKEKVANPEVKRRVRVFSKAMGIEIDDCPRPPNIAAREAKEGGRMVKEHERLWGNPRELEKTIKRGPPTNADVGISPEVRMRTRYMEYIMDDEDEFEAFLSASNEEQLAMAVEHERLHPHNPDGLLSLDYTGPPGKRTFAKNPEPQVKNLLTPEKKRRSELIEDGLRRQRARLIAYGKFDDFELSQKRKLEREKMRLAGLTLEERQQRVADADRLREHYWNQPLQNPTEDREIERALFIYYKFYYCEDLLDQCVTRVPWVHNKDDAQVPFELREEMARIDELLFGEKDWISLINAMQEGFLDEKGRPFNEEEAKNHREVIGLIEAFEEKHCHFFSQKARIGNSEELELSIDDWDQRKESIKSIKDLDL